MQKEISAIGPNGTFTGLITVRRIGINTNKAGSREEAYEVNCDFGGYGTNERIFESHLIDSLKKLESNMIENLQNQADRTYKNVEDQLKEMGYE